MSHDLDLRQPFHRCGIKHRNIRLHSGGEHGTRNAIAIPQIGSELRVVAVRALRNKALDEFNQLQIDLIQRRKNKEISHSEAQYQVEKFWVGTLRQDVKEGDIERGSVMAGQSIRLVNEIRPLKQALQMLINDAEKELAKVSSKL